MNQIHDIVVMFFVMNFEKWFDKPGTDDWVVVGVGEVGALVVPAGDVPYHMTKYTILEETKTYPDLCR